MIPGSLQNVTDGLVAQWSARFKQKAENEGMNPGKKWKCPFELGKEIPRKKIMTGIELNTETGTQTNTTEEEGGNVRYATEEQ